MSQYGENRVPADEQPTMQMAAVSVPAEERPTIQISAVSLPAEQPPGRGPAGGVPAPAPPRFPGTPGAPATGSGGPGRVGAGALGAVAFGGPGNAGAPGFGGPGGSGHGGPGGGFGGAGGGGFGGAGGPAAPGQTVEAGNAAGSAAIGGWNDPTTRSGAGPDSASPSPPARRGRRRALLAGGTVAAVLAVGGTVTGGYAYAGEVPRGTSVLGVDLGGKSRDEAAKALRADLDRRASTFTTPLQVRIGDRTGEVTPSAVGLAVDVEATVAAAAEHRPGPFSLLFGSRDADPVVTVDVEKLDTELRKIVGRTGQQMTLPAITFTGTTPKPVYPKPGKGIRAEDSAKAVREGWLVGQPVVVPLVETHPATTTEELDRLVTEFAKPAVAGAVAVSTDRGDFSIPPAAIAKSLVLTADKVGKIAPRVDEKKLRAALTSQLGRVEVQAKDASISIQGNKPKMRAGSGGRHVDLAALTRDLLPVLPKSDGREVKAQLKAVEPKVSTDDLAKMGIKEKVSSFTTNFTGGLGSSRSQNIVTIARDVDGTLVKPGQTFSLNGHTGERGYAQGYRDAPVILDGKLVPGVGGGTSQFTTTLFNATYYAGLEDVEHKPHSYWFSRYPAVIESTIFWPNLDFKFKNNTPHGVVIDTAHTSSSITVSIWSTKVYDKVTTEYSPRRNITKPRVIKLPAGPSCIPTNGIDGFTQDAFRLFHKGGRVVEREKFTWKYLAEPRYSCG